MRGSEGEGAGGEGKVEGRGKGMRACRFNFGLKLRNKLKNFVSAG